MNSFGFAVQQSSEVCVLHVSCVNTTDLLWKLVPLMIFHFQLHRTTWNDLWWVIWLLIPDHIFQFEKRRWSLRALFPTSVYLYQGFWLCFHVFQTAQVMLISKHKIMLQISGIYAECFSNLMFWVFTMKNACSIKLLGILFPWQSLTRELIIMRLI